MLPRCWVLSLFDRSYHSQSSSCWVHIVGGHSRGSSAPPKVAVRGEASQEWPPLCGVARTIARNVFEGFLSITIVTCRTVSIISVWTAKPLLKLANLKQPTENGPGGSACLFKDFSRLSECEDDKILVRAVMYAASVFEPHVICLLGNVQHRVVSKPL